ncbi:MAG TPA: glycosyltransferase family 9 protein [Thermomicrobiaceae bacterium]|nr:glycosyltransferase family 9 protein [Thermomicrobiaceae bacterium]
MTVAAPERILIVKLADLGDALLATPAIRALRLAFPAARLDALTTVNGAAALALSPNLNRIVTFPKELFDRPAGIVHPRRGALLGRLAVELRASRYDAVILLHHLTTGFGALKFRALVAATGAPIRAGLDNGLGTFLTHRAPDYGFGPSPEWRYALDVVALLGATTEPVGPAIAVPDPSRASADKALEGAGVDGSFVVIHPSVGAFSPARTWPLERFVAVTRRLRADLGTHVVAVGSADDSAAGRALGAAGAVDLTGRTTLAEVAALIERSGLVIGCDSGIVHLAGMLGRPLVAIFGPSNAGAWRPIGAVEHRVGRRPFPDASAIVVRAGIPCSPCFYVGYGLGRREGCRVKTCLSLVTPEEVGEAALHLLRRQVSVAERDR